MVRGWWVVALVVGALVFFRGCGFDPAPNPAAMGYLFALVTLAGALVGGYLVAREAHAGGLSGGKVAGLAFVGAFLGALPLGTAALGTLAYLRRTPGLVEGSLDVTRAMLGASRPQPQPQPDVTAIWREMAAEHRARAQELANALPVTTRAS